MVHTYFKCNKTKCVIKRHIQLSFFNLYCAVSLMIFFQSRIIWEQSSSHCFFFRERGHLGSVEDTLSTIIYRGGWTAMPTINIAYLVEDIIILVWGRYDNMIAMSIKSEPLWWFPTLRFYPKFAIFYTDFLSAYRLDFISSVTFFISLVHQLFDV